MADVSTLRGGESIPAADDRFQKEVATGLKQEGGDREQLNTDASVVTTLQNSLNRTTSDDSELSVDGKFGDETEAQLVSQTSEQNVDEDDAEINFGAGESESVDLSPDFGPPMGKDFGEEKLPTKIEALDAKYLLGIHPDADTANSIEQSQYQDLAAQKEEVNEKQRILIQNPDTPVAEKVSQIRELQNKPKLADIGEMALRKQFLLPPTIEGTPLQDIATEITTSVNTNANNEVMANILSANGTNDLEGVLRSPFLTGPMVLNQEGTDFELFENIPDTASQVEARRIAASERLSSALPNFKGANTLFDEGQSRKTINSWQEYIEFARLRGNDTEFGGEAAYLTLLAGIVRDGEISTDAERMMTGHLGKDWKSRMGSFLASEIGPDAFILWAMSSNPAFAPITGPLAAASTAQRGAHILSSIASKSKFLKIASERLIKRIVITASGGGISVTFMDRGANRREGDPEFDFAKNLAINVGTRAVLDPLALGVLKVAGKGANKLLGSLPRRLGGAVGDLAKDTATKTARKLGLEVADMSARKTLINADGSYTSNVAALMTRASLHAQHIEYGKLYETIASGVIGGMDRSLQGAGELFEKQRMAIIRQAGRLLGLQPEEIGQVAYQDMIEKVLVEGVEGLPTARALTSATAEEQAALLKNIKILEKDKVGLKLQLKRIRTVQKALVKSLARANAPIKGKRTAKQEAKHAEKITRLQTALDGAGERLTDASSSMDNLNATLSKVSKIRAEASTGNQMMDRVLTGESIGVRLMGDVSARQEGVQNMFNMFIAPNMKSAWRENHLDNGGRIFNGYENLNPAAWSKALKALLNLTEPTEFKGGWGAIARDLWDSVNLGNRVNRAYQNAARLAVKGLNKREVSEVMRLLDKGSNIEKEFNASELMMEGANKHIIDSYAAFRHLLNMTHLTMDAQLVREAHRKSINGFVRGSVGKFRGENWNVITDINKEQGSKYFGKVKISDVPDSGAPGREMWVNPTDLDPVESMLPYIKGYLPRVYKDAKFHVSVMNMKTGAVERVGVAPSQNKAMDLFEAVRTERKFAEHEQLVMNSWHEGTGTSKVAFNTQGGMKFMDISTKEQAEAMKKLLGDTMDLNAIRVGMNFFDRTTMQAKFIGARSNKPMKTLDKNGKLVHAEFRETDQSLMEYFQNASDMQGVNRWSTHAKETWQEMYKDVLVPNASIWDGNAVTGSALITGKVGQVVSGLTGRRASAKKMQKWIKRTITRETFAERLIDNGARHLISRGLESSNPVAKRAAMIMDDFATSTARVLGFQRSTLASHKLLAFSTAQFVVQGVQGLVSAGAHPLHAMGALKDITKLSVARSMMESGLGNRVSSEMKNLLNVLQRSGNFADLITTDLEGFAAGVPASGAVKIFHAARKVPFRTGEAINRLSAWMTIRRLFIDLHTKGKLVENGVVFKGAIDDDEFIRLVGGKARLFSLNMGRAGQLESLSGLGSVVFQFFQVGPKFLNIFEVAPDLVKGVTRREKLSVAATVLAIMGPGGLPLVGDILVTADKIMAFPTDNPTKQQIMTDILNNSVHDFSGVISELVYNNVKQYGMTEDQFNSLKIGLERAAKKGLPYAFSDAEIEIVHRVTLGSIWTDLAGNTSNATTFVPFMDFAADYLDAVSSTVKYVVPNAIYWMETMKRYDDLEGRVSVKEIYKELVDGEGLDAYGDAVGTNQEELTRGAMNVLGKWGSVTPIIGGIANLIQNSEIASKDFRPREEQGPGQKPFDRPLVRNGVVYMDQKASAGRVALLTFGLNPGVIQDAADAHRLDETIQRHVEAYVQKQRDRLLEIENPAKAAQIVRETREVLANMPSYYRNTLRLPIYVDGEYMVKEFSRDYMVDKLLKVIRSKRGGE